MVALLRNRLCCCHTASKSANALWTPVACGLACVVYSGSPFYWFILVYRVLVCESIADSTILWKPWDRLVQKASCAIPEAKVHPNRNCCLPTIGENAEVFKVVLWFCPWLQRHRHQCMSSVRSKNPENKAKHCQMSFAAYAERCWESWFHWHKFEIVLRTYAIFGVTNRLDTNNGSSRFFDGFSMHIHGLPLVHPSSWNPMLSSNSTSTECCGQVSGSNSTGLNASLARDLTKWIEVESGSKIAIDSMHWRYWC